VFLIEENKVEGGAGITAGGNVVIRNVTGQVAVGSNITQTQTISGADKKELHDCLVQFRDEVAKLNLPQDEATMVNGDVTAAIKEAKKENPDPVKIKSRVEGALDTIKEVGTTIEKVSKWTWTKKILKILGKLGLSILL